MNNDNKPKFGITIILTIIICAAGLAGAIGYYIGTVQTANEYSELIESAVTQAKELGDQV